VQKEKNFKLAGDLEAVGGGVVGDREGDGGGTLGGSAAKKGSGASFSVGLKWTLYIFERGAAGTQRRIRGGKKGSKRGGSPMAAKKEGENTKK